MARPGFLEWVMGTGYIRLWEQIHRLQEATILFGPRDRVIAAGVDDETRLLGSTIDNRDLLLGRLREAVGVMMAAANVGPAYLPRTQGPPAVPTPTANDELVARGVLRDVRRAINEFRDERRLGLVRARSSHCPPLSCPPSKSSCRGRPTASPTSKGSGRPAAKRPPI